MITPKTIVLFLVGNRSAIEKIADCKWSLLLGLLFIVSAGLARNYDHHILTREFLWIGGPVGMSLFSSIFIFGFIKIFGRLRSDETYQNFLPFLRCFVTTAPLAWLYGIPVEQFTTSLNSAIFNFSILLLVSFWRVALMIRVVVVIFNFHPLRAFSLVAIPASFEMFFGSIFKGIDIVGVMAGMSLTEADSFLLSATRTVTMGSVILFCISFCLAFCSRRGDVKNREAPTSRTSIHLTTWCLSILVIALWIWASKVPQERLANLEEFRTLIRSENYEKAAKFAETISEDGFPRHHQILPKRFSFHPPFAIKLLSYHNDWPTWLEDNFKEDVAAWLANPRQLARGNSPDYFDLYRDLEDAPYVQEAADKVTPGIKASDFFQEEEDPKNHFE